MENVRLQRNAPPTLIPTMLLVAFLSLVGTSTAQVTASGNGSASTNGLTITEGTNITAVSASETLWADSTDGRLKVTNHGVSTQFDLGLWPCRSSPGGIVKADTTTTVGVYQETCLGVGSSGQLLLLTGGTLAPAWSAGLTFVSPLLTVGTAGTNTGQVALTNSGNSNTITLQSAASPAASRTYTVPDGGGSSNIGLTTGTLTSGNYASWDANGNAKDSGANAGPYSIPWNTVPNANTGTTGTFDTGGNTEVLWGVTLTFPLTTTQVTYNAATADSTAHLYGLGILNSSGTVVLHIGPTAGSTIMTSGAHTVSWVEGSTTLQPGKYYLVLTTNCTSACAVLSAANSNAITFLQRSVVTITTGGTVQTVTPAADAYSWVGTIPSWAVR
jgi:hypothetical protein